MKRGGVGFDLIGALALITEGRVDVTAPATLVPISPQPTLVTTPKLPQPIVTVVASSPSPAPSVSGSAGTGSLVYVLDANVWLAAPNGSGARPLTTDGTDAD